MQGVARASEFTEPPPHARDHGPFPPQELVEKTVLLEAKAADESASQQKISAVQAELDAAVAALSAKKEALQAQRLAYKEAMVRL